MQASQEQLPFNEKKQDALLGHTLVDDKFFRVCKDRLKAEWFSGRDGDARGKIWTAKVNFYKRLARCPSHDELRETGEWLDAPAGERTAMNRVFLEALNIRTAYGLDLLSDELDTWMHARIFQEGFLESEALYNAGKTKEAYTAMEDRLKVIRTTNFKGSAAYDFSLMREHAARRQLETKYAITFGSRLIDKLLLPQGETGGLLGGDTTIVLAPTNLGKCLGRGTPIMDSEGRQVNVEDVRAGDLLMGPDGKPRRVLSVTRGTGPLFEVTPKVGGNPWVCNDVHVLSLKGVAWAPDAGKITNISLDQYKNKSRNWKRQHSLWRAALDFQHRALPVDPYILGLWLGDGNSDRAALTTMDPVLRDIWTAWVESQGDTVKPFSQEGNKAQTYMAQCGPGASRVQSSKIFRDLGWLGNKHIPHEYLTSSRTQRLALLAGLLDTDGFYLGDDNGVYEITQKSIVLAEGIAFLGRSLGFKVCVAPTTKADQNGTAGLYQRCTIMGALSQIPVRLTHKKATDGKKDPTTTGFRVKAVGVGEYFGFTLDGDHLFLLGDFTVTHNTTCKLTVAAANVRQRKSCLVITHEGVDDDIAEKMTMSLLNVDRAEFYRMCASQDPLDRRYIDSAMALMQRYVTYLPMNRGGQNVETVVSAVRQAQDQRLSLFGGKGYDLLVDDYPAKLLSENMKYSQFQKRNLDEYIYDQFVQLALEYKFHCLLAIQANRTGSKINRGQKGFEERLLTMEDVNESYGPMQIATNVITLNRDPWSEANDWVTYYISKSRSSDKGWAVVCKSKFANAVTHSDSMGGFWYKGTVPVGPLAEQFFDKYRDSIVMNDVIQSVAATTGSAA